MTVTLNKEFSDFCAQRDAQNTIQLNIIKWSWMLCDSLRQNYIDVVIPVHKSFIEKGDRVEYHQACIDDIKAGKCGVDFTIESGRKYHKIIMKDSSGSRSAHCFVDKKTGSVLKSASWKAPAKGERFNLCLIKDREWMMKNADWSGSYLYKR